MMNRFHTAGRASLVAGLLLVTACAGMAGWEDVLGMPGSGGDVRGEVDRVDARGREIRVVSGWGQATRVSYDARTEVIADGRRHPVSGLERGDIVSMRVRRDRYGDLYTDRIYLERDARAGRGGNWPRDRVDGRRGAVARVDGRVGDVDARDGRFELRDGRYEYTVVVPRDAHPSVRDRVRRLRRGERVRLEVRTVNERRLAVYRFLR